MLRDLKLFRRNSGKIPCSEEPDENLPTDASNFPAIHLETDPSRPPLNAIQEPARNPKPGPDQETILRRKTERTPSKNKNKDGPNAQLLFRTPEKPAASRNRFGWGMKMEGENGDELSHQGNMPPLSRGGSMGNGGGHNMVTPRAYRPPGKASSVHSDSSSTQSTPTKSVSKPTCSGFGGFRPPMGAGVRTMNFSVAPSKGIPMSLTTPPVYIAAEVPHFELREDPSFWMDNNVQVVIRIRPLNSIERSVQGYSRCLKQESTQNITWIGQPETLFTFDYVACETVNQEMLFRVAGLPMVENCMSGYNSCMFAYGQTGSGKTYTMLGEIGDSEFSSSTDRGMTPRIFEFLFARIRAEEESRRDEKLKYNCKCSFLEIYNEQITDLLDPSSTNLLLREDIRKGVYVENLTELEVTTVNDILKLLFQGAANRKVAATNMNRESSRSHSVFTCVIESRWEKDSTTNLRFARLNLVDLAGSERQKTSGAEGERLKEAASINKSLSTLGHVIMVLADVAHGKQRHVPYRDSRLTFLLQDSLGGNSKTMIIANISPSICSANETLGTLKFAQRAKLIQNNAIVNEDASGDVTTLQHQIRLLKEELSVLRHQNVSRSLSLLAATVEDSEHEGSDASIVGPESAKMNVDGLHGSEASQSIRVSTKQLKSLEATLAGALRREKMAETAIKQLEAEIEQLNRLVRQREEDTRSSKMMLKFREDKIQRMEALLDGQLPPDSYILEENNVLSEEIQLLQARADRNPEVTRFALENIRLLEQLRRFQDFYEEGERELLLTEVSEMRNQLIQILDNKSVQDQHLESDMEPQVTFVCFDNKSVQDQHLESNMEPQLATYSKCSSSIRDDEPLHMELKRTSKELEDCRNKLKFCLEINATLTREINSLHNELTSIRSASHGRHDYVEPEDMDLCSNSPPPPGPLPNKMNHAEEILNLQLELDILKTILGEEKTSRMEVEERANHVNEELKAANERVLQISKHHKDTENEVKDAKLVIEALESQNLLSINELEELRESNNQLVEFIKKQEEIPTLRNQHGFHFDGIERVSLACGKLKGHPLKHCETEDSPLQEKLKRMQVSLEKARSLNISLQSDHASQTSLEQEMDDVRRQVEVETSEVIVCLQEELIALQQRVDESTRKELLAKESLTTMESEIEELRERLCLITHENERLDGLLQEKERGIKSSTKDWERLASEIAVLADETVGPVDSHNQVASASVPDNNWVTDQIRKMTRSIMERDLSIEELQKCLKDAQNAGCDMEEKLRYVTEAQQQETSHKEREILWLTSQLSEKMSTISELENKIKLGEEQFWKAEIGASVAYAILSRSSEISMAQLQELEHVKVQLYESAVVVAQKDAALQDRISFQAEADRQIEALMEQLKQSQEQTTELFKLLKESQEHSQALEYQLKEKGEGVALSRDDLLETTKKLKEVTVGVNMLHSFLSEHVEGTSSLVQDKILTADYDSKHQIGIGSNEDVIDNKQHDFQNATGCSIDSVVSNNATTCVHGLLSEDIVDRETAVVLLTRELDFALHGLKGVQTQMVKLIDEKEEIKKSKIQKQESIEHLTVEMLQLKSEIIDKEHRFELRLLEVEEKLQTVEENAMASKACWHKAKEELKIEVNDAKAIAAQKTIEASNLLIKIEEVQETMRDADIVVNALMEAKETTKLEVERYKEVEATLNHERSCLISEVQALESSLSVKDNELERMEELFRSNLTEVTSSVLALEDSFKHLQDTFTEKFKLIDWDLNWLKSQLHHHMHLARAWLEETWAEIIQKDCSMSVLHLCHMGFFLERIAGLNAENGFLYHGLCESNSVIADLREHNVKTRRELEVCSNLRGKLLLDINNSFTCITKKEDETVEFRARLNTFENKILHLQLLEESMLDRSNYMGTQLASLMKELDANNRNALTAVTAQENLSREKEELSNQLGNTSKLLDEVQSVNEILRGTLCDMLDLLGYNSYPDSSIKFIDLKAHNLGLDSVCDLYKFIKCQIEAFVIKMYAKDLQLLVLTSELEQKTTMFNQICLQIFDLEKQRDTFSMMIEKVNEENILHIIDMELKNSEVVFLLAENEKLNKGSFKLREGLSTASDELQRAKIELASYLRHASAVDEENHRLQDIISSLEACIARVQTDLNRKNTELEVISRELDLKNEVMEIQSNRISSLERDCDSLKNEQMALKQQKDRTIGMLDVFHRHSSVLAQSLNASVDRKFNALDSQMALLRNRMCEGVREHEAMASKFVDEVELLELCAKALISDNISLQSELMRKDEVSEGLLFDLSLLQESASIARDQKDKLEELAATLEILEDEVASKSSQLDEAVAHRQVLEAQLLEKDEKMAGLEIDLAEKLTTLKLALSENLELKAHMEHILQIKSSIEEELTEKNKVTQCLEEEMLKTNILAGQRNHLLDDLHDDMTRIADERDHLNSEIHDLKGQIEMAQALAEEKEAIATEARQIAQERKAYAEDKEEEVKLLEKSVEELECTVNALENKVEIVKGEAERQRLQREELEMELEAVRHQMLTAPVSGNIWKLAEGRNTDATRNLREKVTELQEAQQNIHILQKEVADKEAEIVQCKAHISELNMHGEAQAREYKQKFRELEAMAQLVRADSTSSNATSLTSTKSEKGAAKPRGSGSPFKCIGLGFAQQMNSEKDEELTAARHHIEELEALAASRQKEIFMLNTRLAAAESMTHDVIRDLLGVKLDMTSYASLLDHQQAHKVKEETAQFDSQAYEEKEREVTKLKKQLNKFIEERESWLNEINQRHTDMVAAQIALEKLRQREQFLTAENEMLKVDNSKYKKVVMGLEDEVKKLSDQQHLQQRIHHHAKTKEENRLLRIHNEDISTKLQRSETILSRVKEELARYRAACGKQRYVDIDEEEQLREKLNESEVERIQLAQKLLSLCTYILKVAGLSAQPSSNISPSVAEDALNQLENRIKMLEREVQNQTLKCKLSCEKLRMSEIKQQQSSSMQDNSPSPVPQSFHACLRDDAVERG